MSKACHRPLARRMRDIQSLLQARPRRARGSSAACRVVFVSLATIKSVRIKASINERHFRREIIFVACVTSCGDMLAAASANGRRQANLQKAAEVSRVEGCAASAGGGINVLPACASAWRSRASLVTLMAERDPVYRHRNHEWRYWRVTASPILHRKRNRVFKESGDYAIASLVVISRCPWRQASSSPCWRYSWRRRARSVRRGGKWRRRRSRSAPCGH